MLVQSIVLCFFFSFIPLNTAKPGVDELIIDQSCKNFATFGDVTAQLNKAYTDAQLIAADAHMRIDALRRTLKGEQGLLADTEILRLERLLVAFFIGPFKDASSPPLGRIPDNDGYEETSSSLEANLGVITAFGVSTMPPMFCDPPILSQQEAAGLSNNDKKGKWVKIIQLPNGDPVLDPTTKKPSFYIEDYFAGVPNSGIVHTLQIGEDPCRGNAIAATYTDQWMLWCPKNWDLVNKAVVPTDPSASENQHTDFSTLFYRFSNKRKIDYWRTSIADSMLHEMHHVYIGDSTDIIVQSMYPSQKPFVAYGYAGTAQLAENVRFSRKYDMLSQNADSMAIFAVAAYLDGCDWSLLNAQPLTKITDVVTIPPTMGKPNGKMLAAKRRVEKRYAEKRRAEKRARMAVHRFRELALPMSPVGGREI